MTLRSRIAVVLLSTLPVAGPSSFGGDEPKVAPDRPEPLPSLSLLQGPWSGGVMRRESVLFLKAEGGRPRAKLFFDADRILEVRSADGLRTFEAGRDYQVSPDGATLELPDSTRVPFREEADLFRPEGVPNRIPYRVGHPKSGLLFGEGHFFHDQQAEVSYLPRRAEWKGYRPTFAGDRLKRTVETLRKKEPLTIVVSGDSISQGYNASGYTKVAPFMPAYSELVAAQLGQTYGAKVTLHNLAIAGWSSGLGLKDVDHLIERRPDLVIIAYGMNDVGARNPSGFKANIKAMLDRIRASNPAVEVILVASMIGNPEWVATPKEMFPVYRDALASLEGPGVVLADLTAVWQVLLERKSYLDMTGNGVNHPNDFGHRLYAQTILSLLVDPVLLPQPSTPNP